MLKITSEQKAIIEKLFSDSRLKNLQVTEEVKQKNGVHTFVISTNQRDRHGEIVLQSGLEMKYWEENPVVILDHDYTVEKIVGRGIAVRKLADTTEVDVLFADNELGQYTRKLCDDGMLNMCSIGFIPKKVDSSDKTIFTEAEMIELSIVVVGSNRGALRKMADEERTKLYSLGLFKDIASDEDLEEVPAEAVPAPEVTPEEEAVIAEPEEKGAVADEYNKETKEKNVGKIYDLYSSFVEAYYWNGETPVSDFEKLAKELAELITLVAEGKEIPKEVAAKIADNVVKARMRVAVKDAEPQPEEDEPEVTPGEETPGEIGEVVKQLQAAAKIFSSSLQAAKKIRDAK